MSVNGRPVASWDEIVDGIANTPEPEIRLQLADGSTVTAPIHQDALEQRLKASQALQPYRAPVVGQVRAGPPGRPGRASSRATRSPPWTAGRCHQWYDLLETAAEERRPAACGRGRPRGRPPATSTSRRTSTRSPGPNGKPQAIGRIGVAVAGDFRSEPLSLGQAVVEGWHGTVGASTQIVRTVRGSSAGGSPSGRWAGRS